MASLRDSYHVWHAKGLRAVKMMKGTGCYNLLEPTGVLFLHQHIPLILQHWQCLPHIKDDTPEQVTVINANKTYCYHPITSSVHSHHSHGTPPPNSGPLCFYFVKQLHPVDKYMHYNLKLRWMVLWMKRTYKNKKSQWIRSRLCKTLIC